MTASRTVTVALWRGGTMTLPCPDWCIGHEAALIEQHPNDVAHEGPDTGLDVQTENGVHRILEAGLVQLPYSSRDPLPYATLGVRGYERVTPDQLRAAADGLEQHAVFLRTFATEVEQVRAAVELEYRPANLPAHLPWPARFDGGDE